MHKYALTKPSSYYLSQFHEESIKIKPVYIDNMAKATRREISGGTQRSRPQLP
jgi:hypothetical protein